MRVMHTGKALQSASDIVLAAEAQKDRALQHSSEALLSDSDIVLAAGAQNCQALQQFGIR